MNLPSIQARYDSFQEPAVENIVSDFSRKIRGRYLLVIPTGGGKTFTAVKAVNRLFEVGTLDPQKDRVLWTAHRNELLTQALDTFKEFEVLYPDKQSFLNQVTFLMIAAADDHISANNQIKLVVLDEAHHAALKNVNYGPLFKREEVGILGLTATPSRHDGLPLDFECESFSIGFPDLVRKGIVLKPEIREIVGGSYDITNIDDVDSLEQLNNVDRNQTIVAELLKHSDEYKKVIIYVGTANHVISLYDQLSKSALKAEYDSIAWITGEANSRTQERDEFIATEKRWARSILVNVMVLTEGYDDPSINTVVMAAPSTSKLYYMQAMGRAIRHNKNDTLKQAYCLEVADKLPNIRYRIDNRWLFSDISDTLEPAVLDEVFGSEEEFRIVLQRLYGKYEVPAKYGALPIYDKDQRYSVLLFRKYLAPDKYAHYPLIISNNNRLQVCNFFNFISERMEIYRKKGIVTEAALHMVGGTAFTLLDTEEKRRWVFEAMKCALPKEKLKEPDPFSDRGYPWITFASLRYQQPKVSEEILAFIAEFVNREEILKAIVARSYESGSCLIRLPLPLASYIGKIITSGEFATIDTLVQRMRTLRVEKGRQDHRMDLHGLISTSIIPIELAFNSSLVLIARDNDPYHLTLI